MTAPVKVVTGSGSVTWGVPWPRGEVGVDAAFRLGEVPVQSWPLATWPDGSLKWSGHAVSSAASGDLEVGESAAPELPVLVEDGPDEVAVRVGRHAWYVPRTGALLDRVVVDGRQVSGPLRLVSQRAAHPGPGDREEWVGDVTQVTVEQSGPVRAVVALRGAHRPAQGPSERAWLPFTVRLAWFAGTDEVRITHSFIWDGDPERDFLAALGVQVEVPLVDDPVDRHVRIAGPLRDGGTGFCTEAVRGITGLRRDPGAEARANQMAGRPVGGVSDRVSGLLHWVPTWDAWRLDQLSPDGFTLAKRTASDRPWVMIPGGTRSAGLAYLGGISGGVALGVRDFWRSFPASLEIAGASGDAGSLTAWLWSPRAEPMDLHAWHDDLGTHGWGDEVEAMEITYEDYEPGFPSPHGIARTHELRLAAYAATPAHEVLAELSQRLEDPGVVAAEPAYLRHCRVFGDWDLPDRTSPAAAAIEDRLDWFFDYYVTQREERRWYGFWDYGDIMHTYDPDRHQWRYDVGGYAWDNSELSPDLWLWYQFLRTGRADVYRFAEAMTRHTGEVDVYHLGRFARLGSRHNVQHWGCSAKQVRISSAAYRRIFYYLSADERVGDLLAELVDAEETFASLDPNRKVRQDGYVADPHVVSIGLGTDWSALASAWLTAWERVGDETVRAAARDKLLGTMSDIGALPKGFLTG
ncbi:MAG TPA: Tat pathway signal sequence domain protein, partial [Propionibacteriaceae bacterium]|nr:Tat pathway signal sequence domain protein [Propionibacteriaceae bacterium]